MNVLLRRHEHHTDKIPDGSAVSLDPIDSILWAHIFLMIIAFGIIFPTGMVLGLTKSRMHVPTQVFGTVIAVVAFFLAHAHKGRQFTPDNIHAKFVIYVVLIMAAQVGLGVYLRLHLKRGYQALLRPKIVRVHGVLGKMIPVVVWVQMLFGGITALGFCRSDHLGQCLAHFIMGSSFIAYGIILLIMLYLGQPWLRRINKSQEFLDSAVITAWGIVNTFTEHRWGNNWSHKDFQHTAMGIIWWCAGILGLLLSKRNGRPSRNLIPAVVIFLTGWAMSGHAQALMLSTKVHATFGYTLMSAGIVRIIEISFVLRDGSGEGEVKTFQHLTPYLLIASGYCFMGANEEQLLLVASLNVDHVSYLLCLYSIAFLTYAYVFSLIVLYTKSGKNATPGKNSDLQVNGNGLARDHEPFREETENRGTAAAQEFELLALIESDEEGTDARSVDEYK